MLLPRPVILDPADPTGNVAGGKPERWEPLAGEARVWMTYPCFRKGDGSPVGSWNIQVRPLLPPCRPPLPSTQLGDPCFQRNCLSRSYSYRLSSRFYSNFIITLTPLSGFLEWPRPLFKVHSLPRAALAEGHFLDPSSCLTLLTTTNIATTAHGMLAWRSASVLRPLTHIILFTHRSSSQHREVGFPLSSHG